MEWNLVVNSDFAGLETLDVISGTYNLAPNESVVMYIANADVVFVPAAIEDAVTLLQGEEFSWDNLFDKESLIQAIQERIHEDAIVEITENIDYDAPAYYNIYIKVTDQFGNVSNEIVTIHVVEGNQPSSSGIELIIGAIVGGIIAIGAGLFFFIFKKS